MGAEKRAFWAALLLILVGAAGRADTTVKRLAPGVTLTQEIDKQTPLIVNVLTVDLDAPGVRVGVGVGQDRVNGPDGGGGREEVSRQARRHGALAAVNADFFALPVGDPLGLGIRDGELFSEPWWGNGRGGPRAALGVVDGGTRVVFDTLGFLGDLQAPDGQRARLAGIDRKVGAGEIVAFTPLYGPATGNRPGGTEVVLTGVNLPVRANKLMAGRVGSVTANASAPQAIPPGGVVLSGAPGAGADWLAQHVQEGDRVSFVLAVAPPAETANAVRIAQLPRTGRDLPSRAGAGLSRPAWLWGRVQEAVGGGPRLLTHGQVTVDGAAEGFDPSIIGQTHPRTAVGTSKDGRRLLLVTVDGRQALSKGVALTDLALILKRYGAWDAINLDGGGSTAMAVAGLVVSSPSGSGTERRVADTLLVYSDRVATAWQPAPPRMRLAIPTNGPVLVGSVTPIHLLDGAREVSGDSPRLLWQGPATNGIGFVNQKGYFIAAAPGTGAVMALYKGYLVAAQITVTSPAPVVSTYTLSAEFAVDGSGARRSQLVVRILDKSGQPLADAPIHVAVTGGAAAPADIRTNADGYAVVDIRWNADAGGSALVTSGTLTPVTVQRP